MESVSDRAAGAGLKAAFRYFDGEDIPAGSLTAQAFTVFCVIRPYIDEAKRDFEKSVESGKKGAENRWGNNSPPIPSHSPPIANDSSPIGCLREAEAEAEADISILTDREGGRTSRPSAPALLRLMFPRSRPTVRSGRTGSTPPHLSTTTPPEAGSSTGGRP